MPTKTKARACMPRGKLRATRAWGHYCAARQAIRRGAMLTAKPQTETWCAPHIQRLRTGNSGAVALAYRWHAARTAASDAMRWAGRGSTRARVLRADSYVRHECALLVETGRARASASMRAARTSVCARVCACIAAKLDRRVLARKPANVGDRCKQTNKETRLFMRYPRHAAY